MFVRKLPSEAVCLGCRLRLLSRATRPQRSLVSALDQRQRLRWFTSSPSPRSGYPERPHGNAGPLSADERDARHLKRPENDDPIPSYRQPGDAGDSAAFRPTSQEYIQEPEERGPSRGRRIAFNKNHRSKYRLLTETAASLGTDMLGKPAYAIVMKDRGPYRQSKLVSSATEAPDELHEQPEQRTSLDFEAFLDEQRKPVTMDEVQANIEELRPKSELILPQKAFHEIQDALEDGFLVPHLQDYIKQFKPTVKMSEAFGTGLQAEEIKKDEEVEDLEKNEEEEEGEEGEVEEEEYDGEDALEDMQMAEKGAVRRAEYPWIRGVTPWVRLNSKDIEAGGLSEDADRQLHGYVSEDDSKKSKLAVRIMRECWGLQIEEFMGGLGEVEVTVTKREFTLLMRGSQRFLRYIGNRCLDQGESLEAFRNRNTLRIIASRPKTETVLSQLDETLQNIKCRHFPTVLVADPHFFIDPDLLEEVGRLTNTKVKQTTNKRRIQVTWLETKSREDADYDVEDLRHVVFRLLSVALRPSTALSKLWGADLPIPQIKGRYLIDSENKQKWGWKDRLGTWARFVLPRGPEITREMRPLEVCGSKSPLDDIFGLKEPIDDSGSGELEGVGEKESGSPDKGGAERPDEQGMDDFEKYVKSSGREENAEALDRPRPEAVEEKVDLFGLLDMPVERQPPLAEEPQTESGQELPDVIPIIEASDMSPSEVSEVEVQKQGNHPYQPVRWSPELTTATTAIFGHILHAKVDAPPYSSMQKHGHQLEQRHLFSPVAPHPHQLASLGLGADTSTFPASSTILIRFAPSATSNPLEPALPAPPLELRLSLSDTAIPKITGVHSFRALVDTHIHDIMLPANSVDLRVTQTSLGHIQGRAQDIMDWQPVWNFLSRARLELENNKLEMPHAQRFQVPPRLFAVNHTPPEPIGADRKKPEPGRRIRRATRIARTLKNKIPEDPNANVSVPYDFAGLELHRSVSIPHDGFDLTYTSIEAGQGGGRRAELSLSPATRRGLPNEPADEIGQDLQRRFFEVCYKLAEGSLFTPRE